MASDPHGGRDPRVENQWSSITLFILCIFIKDIMLTLIKITCCNTYAKHYQQSSKALKIRSAGKLVPPGL